MISKLLAVIALAVATKAAIRAPPQTQFEADVRTIIDPIVEWNDKLCAYINLLAALVSRRCVV